MVQRNKDIYSKIPKIDKVFDMLRVASKGISFEKNGVNIINLYLKEFLKSEGINLDLKLQFLLVVCLTLIIKIFPSQVLFIIYPKYLVLEL